MFNTFLIGLIVRAGISDFHHSGQNNPPLYGDYEAQRHWTYLTNYIDIDKWYEYDLEYWGLDYPPLTAYHSWVLGYIYNAFSPDFVLVKGSVHFIAKFMILFFDLFFFMIPVSLLFPKDKWLNLFLHPCFLFIDYAHFQYNCISLGLILYALYFYKKESYLLCAFSYACAFLYKQTMLYVALSFFICLLQKCRYNYLLFLKLGILVISVVIVTCWPFRPSSLLSRIFPSNRGIYEDYVANVWLLLTPILPIRDINTNRVIPISYTLCSILSIIFISVVIPLFKRVKSLEYMCLISSLTFFLFSIQVHEKAILQVVLFVFVYGLKNHSNNLYLVLLNIISICSLRLLMEKDDNLGIYILYSFIYVLYLTHRLSFGILALLLFAVPYIILNIASESILLTFPFLHVFIEHAIYGVCFLSILSILLLQG